MERLQKVIAASGLCSRRKAEELILAGKVTVNGTRQTTLGTKVTPEDTILVNGQPLAQPSRCTYLVYKPKGYVCSRAQQGTAPLVGSLVPPEPAVYPVGRLDKESEGLLLLSNDGQLAYQVTHPSFAHEREYEVWCQWQSPQPLELDRLTNRLLKGVKLGDGVAVAKKASLKLGTDGIVMQVTVSEGRHHLVRRMCAVLNLKVTRLRRLRFGPLSLGTLAPGAYRRLTDHERLVLVSA